MANTVKDAPIDPMSLRSIIQKIVVADNKTPITFNVYDKKNKLLFGFIHSKAQTSKVIKDDYEFLDGSILDKQVSTYNIISTNSVSITLVDEITGPGADDTPEENTEENNG